MIRTGVIDAIKEEFNTKVVCKEIYVNELNIVTPRKETKVIK